MIESPLYHPQPHDNINCTSNINFTLQSLKNQLEKVKLSQSNYRLRLQALNNLRSKITNQVQTLTKDYERKIKYLQNKIQKIINENNQLKKKNTIYQSQIQNFQKRLIQKEKLIAKVFMRDSETSSVQRSSGKINANLQFSKDLEISPKSVNLKDQNNIFLNVIQNPFKQNQIQKVKVENQQKINKINHVKIFQVTKEKQQNIIPSSQINQKTYMQDIKQSELDNFHVKSDINQNFNKKKSSPPPPLKINRTNPQKKKNYQHISEQISQNKNIGESEKYQEKHATFQIQQCLQKEYATAENQQFKNSHKQTSIQNYNEQINSQMFFQNFGNEINNYQKNNDNADNKPKTNSKQNQDIDKETIQQKEQQNNFQNDNQPKIFNRFPPPSLKKLTKPPISISKSIQNSKRQPAKKIPKYKPVNQHLYQTNQPLEKQTQIQTNKNKQYEEINQNKNQNQHILQGLVDSQQYHSNNKIQNQQKQNILKQSVDISKYFPNHQYRSQNQKNNEKQTQFMSIPITNRQNLNDINDFQRQNNFDQQNISYASSTNRSKRGKRTKPKIKLNEQNNQQNLIDFVQSQIKENSQNFNQLNQFNNLENEKKALDFFSNLRSNTQQNVQTFVDQSSIQQIQDASMMSNTIFPEQYDSHQNFSNPNQISEISIKRSLPPPPPTKNSNINKKMQKKKGKRENIKVLDPNSFE